LGLIYLPVARVCVCLCVCLVAGGFQAKNRDPSGRELWEGARVEAAPAGGRIFAEATVVKVRVPQPDAFGDVDPDARTSFDVLFDSGKRENLEAQQVVAMPGVADVRSCWWWF